MIRAMILTAMVSIAAMAQWSLQDLQFLYTFDEGQGEIVADSSGNGRDAELQGKGSTWTTGVFGAAVSFSGMGWAEVPGWSTPELGDFTLGCWVRPAAQQRQWATILDSHQAPPQRGLAFEQNSMEHNLFHTIWGDGKDWSGGAIQTQLEPDVWQHFVGVRVGGISTHYINGEVLHTGLAGLEAPVMAGTDNFRIANWVGSGRNFAGAIDEAFLYSRALSADEVQKLHDKGFSKALDVVPARTLATTWASLRTEK